MNAQEAIGQAASGDYHLEPGKHAERLPPEAGPLIRVLGRSQIQVIVDRYERSDGEALAAQKTYKSKSRTAIYSSGVAILAGALLLFLASDAEAKPWVIAIGEGLRFPLLAVQALAICFTAYLTYSLREIDPFSQWMNKRAEAEMARIALFEGVCGVTAEVEEHAVSEGELALLPLQLEYFRRYQLEVELSYYDQRGRQHGAAAKRLVTWGGLLTAVSAIATAGGGLLGEIGFTSATALVLLAVPVALAAHGNLKLLDQDQQNAFRYANTFQKLEAWRSKLDSARTAVAAGDRQALVGFVTGVNSEISLEHREWLTLRQEGDKPTLDLSGANTNGA